MPVTPTSSLRACSARRAPLGSGIGSPRHGAASGVAVLLRNRRACGIPFLALLPAPKAWCAVPIICDGELRTFTNRTNAKTKCFAAPGLKRRGRVNASRNQLATQVEHGGITAGGDAVGFAAVRANELGANPVVGETGNGRPAVGQAIRYGVFDLYDVVSAVGAQRIAALANFIGRRYFHGA